MALCYINMEITEPHKLIIHYLKGVSFYHISQFEIFTFVPAFVFALVEWWRLETYRFHLLSDEATLTLTDVALLTGFRMDEHPIMGISEYNCICATFKIGINYKFNSNGLQTKLTLLNSHFKHLPRIKFALILSVMLEVTFSSCLKMFWYQKSFAINIIPSFSHYELILNDYNIQWV